MGRGQRYPILDGIGMIIGLFKKVGANVSVYTFDSGKTTRDAMISGRSDSGVTGSTPFVVGAAKGELEIGLAPYGSKTLAAGRTSGMNKPVVDKNRNGIVAL